MKEKAWAKVIGQLLRVSGACITFVGIFAYITFPITEYIGYIFLGLFCLGVGEGFIILAKG